MMKSKKLILIFLLAAAVAESQNFRLEDILSAPFPSEMIAAPKADRIAWISNDQGRRNIFIANGPLYAPQQITQYKDDDGQELSELAFSEDGSVLAYVRGGEANKEKEYPNPASSPTTVKQEVFTINLTTGQPGAKELGEGYAPVVSPDGKRVAFTRDGQIYGNVLADGKESSELFHARGQNGNPKWSPDGMRLAFESHRRDHTFVGVFDLQKQQIVWLSPAVDRDFNAVWSIDGKQLAFLRLPGLTGDDPTEIEPRQHLSIWIADADSGKGREVWRSNDDTAGFAQEYPAHPLMWAAGDRLLFYSEKDGWMRIYSISINGDSPIALTPQKCEAEHATLSIDRKHLIFSSNCNDFDRRHLWIAAVEGGKAGPLTKGSGIEWNPVPIYGGKNVALISSTARQPAAPAIIPFSGGSPKLIASVQSNHVPMPELVEPQQVIFQSGDGLQIHGQLFLPHNLKTGTKLPAVIFMHGGPIREMLLGWHYMGYYHNAYGMNQYLASRGYAVLAVNFRCGIGYGRAFRTAANQGPKGASEYQDIVAAAKYLQSRSDIDPHRIGLWGGSYGGYLTALGLARNSDLFAAGVDFHGVHDWSLWAKHEPGVWGIVGDEGMKLAYASSPVASVAFWTSPVLFVHGDDDRNVEFIQTTDLIQRLRAQTKTHIETLVLPDEIHDLLRHQNWLRAYHATADFLDRWLKTNNGSNQSRDH